MSYRNYIKVIENTQTSVIPTLKDKIMGLPLPKSKTS